MAGDGPNGTVELPALFQAADAASLAGQRRHLGLMLGQILMLVGASLTSFLTWESGDVSYSALLGAVAIIFAGVLRVQLQLTKPSTAWYQGRAAAESIKTLSWRYAVGGEPFPVDLSEAEADTRFVERLQDLLGDMGSLTLDLGGEGDEITGWMRTNRAAPLPDRIQLYAEERIGQQRAWYASKAAWNASRARLWGTTMLVIEAFAVVQVLLRATGVVQGNVLGFVATVLAGIMAWVQTKDYETIANAYGVATRELAAISALFRHQETEEDWIRFVASAEDSISREHTLWRASRR